MRPMDWGAAPMVAAQVAAVTIGRLPPDAIAALAASNTHVLAALDWDAVADVAAHGAPTLVVAAVPSDIGYGPLEALGSEVDQHGLDLAVVFEDASMDAVAAVLMGPTATLLCDPAPSDWATALVRPALRASPAPTGVREGSDEAARLRRMHEEVARIAAELARLAERPGNEAVGDRRTRYAAGPGGEAAVDAAEIRRVIRARRLRAQFFPGRLLEDPGWDSTLR